MLVAGLVAGVQIPKTSVEKTPCLCYNTNMAKDTGKKTIKVVKKTTARKKRKIFDSVYRTMATKMPELLIPLINEVFGTRYRQDSKIEQLRNEFYEKGGKIVTDSIFRIGDRLYHIELQSTEDETMALRMMEYDFAIAVGKAKKTGNTIEVNFPESCVIYLRNNGSRPKKHQVKVHFPNGKRVTYESRIINVQDYSADEIFAKKLLLFLPYYIIRYQKQFAQIEKSKEKTAAFLKEIESLRARLEKETAKRNRETIYKDLTELITDISDYLLENQKKLRREVHKTMGGEILELHSERVYKKGRLEGRREGRREGEIKGEKKGQMKELISLVKDGLLTAAQAAARLGEPEETFRARMAKR